MPFSGTVCRPYTEDKPSSDVQVECDLHIQPEVFAITNYEDA